MAYKTREWRNSMRVTLDYNNMTDRFLGEEGFTRKALSAYASRANTAYRYVKENRGKDELYMGWTELPTNQDEIVKDILATAKRIRKDFGKQKSILEVPYLLAIQVDSYRDFLQAGVAPAKRADRGLHAALKSVFPIVSYNGYAALEYVGYKLGEALGQLHPGILIGFGALMGVLVVLAEPAIHVLNRQVEEVTGGLISRRSMILDLCIGVGAAIGLAMLRIVLDFSIIYYVIPGYFISLLLSLFVPKVYTAIAFDSGGVASGPMTSGFILPFAVGACVTVQGADAVLQDAFGVVAVVAMTPLITIQLLGFRAIVHRKVSEKRAMQRILGADDQQIINFM